MLIKGFATLLLCLQISSISAQYAWVQRSSMIMQRYVPATFTIGDFSYVGTGYNQNTMPTGDWWKYDPTTDSWSQVASMPVVRASACAVTIGNKAYAGLGINIIGHLKDWYEFDPLLNSWTQKTNIPGQSRYGSSAFVVGTTAFICCGNTGSATGPFLNTVVSYNAATDSWNQQMSLFPGGARYGGRGATINNKGYIFGGTNGSQFNDMWEYTPSTDSWIKQTDYPDTARNYASVFTFENMVVCGNGVNLGGFAETFYGFVPGANFWLPLPAMPSGEGRWGAGTFSNGGRAFVAWGNKSFNNPTILENDLWELININSIEVNNLNDIHFSLLASSVTGEIRVFINSEGGNKFTIKFFDLSGRCLSDSEIINGVNVIKIPQLSRGIYIASISNNKRNCRISKKFLAE